VSFEAHSVLPSSVSSLQTMARIGCRWQVNSTTLPVFLGRPKAARAVGNALAHNPAAYLIPCHRVLRQSGDFGKYHWGEARKAALIVWEVASDAGAVSWPRDGLPSSFSSFYSRSWGGKVA
jgi:O-6-methylguanine DNA methyltransferase